MFVLLGSEWLIGILYRPYTCVLAGQQRQDVESILTQRWSNVVDGGQTLNQHWFNVFRHVSWVLVCMPFGQTDLASAHTTWQSHGASIVSMRAHRLRHWPNIWSALPYLAYYWCQVHFPANTRRWLAGHVCRIQYLSDWYCCARTGQSAWVRSTSPNIAHAL